VKLSTRAVDEEDRWRLLEWRNSERVRAMSVDDRPIARDVHATWFDRLLEHRRDQVVVVDVDDSPVGVVSLERLDTGQGTASWGCHLGVVEVPPGLGASLPLIGLGLGFGAHGLRRMSAEVLGDNRNMRGIHRRLGIPVEGTRRAALRRADGAVTDVVEYGVRDDEWPGIRAGAARLLPPSIRGPVGAVLDGLARSADG